jgi:hypothetical protein
MVWAAVLAVALVPSDPFACGHRDEPGDRASLTDPTVLDGPRLEGVAGWRADLDVLEAAILRYWSYVEHRRELSGVDVSALVAEARAALADDDATAEDFLEAVTRVASGLQDGHSGVSWSGADLTGPRRWPVVLADAPEGVFVKGSPFALREDETLLPGDLLLAVDGMPIEDVLADEQALTIASSPGQRRATALQSLTMDTYAERLTLTLRREGVSEFFDVEVVCPEYGTPIPAWSLPLWKPEVNAAIAPGVAYWRPCSFKPPGHPAFMAASSEEREVMTAEILAEYERLVDSFADTRALILDLRGNPGGTDLLGQHLAALLLPRGTTYYELQGRSEEGEWFDPHSYPVRDLGGREPYAGQLILIVDERTFSVADNLSTCLAEAHPDITVIGRPTGAGTGAPRAITLPHSGLQVFTCTMRVWGPDGHMIEGRGVVPDVLVTWTIADHLERRDADLAVALERVRP